MSIILRFFAIVGILLVTFIIFSKVTEELPLQPQALAIVTSLQNQDE